MRYVNAGQEPTTLEAKRNDVIDSKVAEAKTPESEELESIDIEGLPLRYKLACKECVFNLWWIKVWTYGILIYCGIIALAYGCWYAQTMFQAGMNNNMDFDLRSVEAVFWLCLTEGLLSLFSAYVIMKRRKYAPLIASIFQILWEFFVSCSKSFFDGCPRSFIVASCIFNCK
ncbi:MAG: hypothetical protein J5802_05105 [Butyrivibrio sp.]|nr:hypothetical protein [Butyrivibrio sp.]